ncbi:MAG: putative S-layer protein [Candidatus Nanoarchaeia archaeon]|nr:putative S-layer protein [Candidatus Nanoarchaeia archaeon]MDD5587974.1 putative S-layer protein [Candidatus Nanoarchaeia archaeon]
MKKLNLLLGILFLVILSTSVFSLSLPSTVTLDEKQAGETATGSLIITNNGANTVTLSVYLQDSSDFEDEDEDAISVSFNPASGISIPATQSKTIAISAIIDDNVDSATYKGNIVIFDGTTTSTVKLAVPVAPEICESGKQGDLKISDYSIKKNPDTDADDEFYLGNDIEVEIDVDNNGDDEVTDIVVEAILYDLTEGEDVASAQADKFDLQDGKDETGIKLTLKVPTDADPDDTYAVYFKASEDGSEEDNCQYESQEVDVKTKDYDMSIDLQSINPSTVNCGSNVDFNVLVKNTGSKDESNVYVKVQDSTKYLQGTTASFDLDSDEDTSKIITIAVPNNITAGSYTFEAFIYFHDGEYKSDLNTANKITVSCEVPNKAPVANAGQDQTVSANTLVILDGSQSSDADGNQLTYKWEQIGGMQTQLTNANANIATFTPTSSGAYLFKLTVNDGKLESSDNILITVSGSTLPTGNVVYEEDSIFGSMRDALPTIAWVLGIIILLLGITFLVKMIFFNRKYEPL